MTRVACPTPVAILDVTAAGNTLDIRFASAVQLIAMPRYERDDGESPTEARQITSNLLTLTYRVPTPANLRLHVYPEDPGVRSSTGGYVLPGPYDVVRQAGATGRVDPAFTPVVFTADDKVNDDKVNDDKVNDDKVNDDKVNDDKVNRAA